MKSKTSKLFLLIVLVQGLHSMEEYIGRLWDNFPPATYLCGLISNDLEMGFLVINIGLFVVGISCWWFVVRSNKSFAITIVGFWIIIELMNGIIHPIWSLIQQRYTPGVLTAPLLFVLAILLIKHSRSSV